jgi:hypothetical protein
VARALLVGCGCRARELGRELIAGGWQVRGTARGTAGFDEIALAGIEPAVAVPDRVGTVLDHVGDVTVVAWLMGSAAGEADEVAALHGPRLERVLEELVDTPVRGFVYEAAGSAPVEVLRGGAEIVRAAGERWRIPVAVLDADPGEWRAWARAAREAVRGLTGA